MRRRRIGARILRIVDVEVWGCCDLISSSRFGDIRIEDGLVSSRDSNLPLGDEGLDS